MKLVQKIEVIDAIQGRFNPRDVVYYLEGAAHFTAGELHLFLEDYEGRSIETLEVEEACDADGFTTVRVTLGAPEEGDDDGTLSLDARNARLLRVG